MTLPEVGERTGEMIATGRVTVDPAHVKNAKYSTKAASELVLFHYDFINLIVGSQINLFAQFNEMRSVNNSLLPLYRLIFDKPIFRSGNKGSRMESSLLAMHKELATEVFLDYYVPQAVFVDRFTKKQREEYETSTGKKLLDVYWEVKYHDLSLPDKNNFRLFLPTGLDFSVIPIVDTDGVIVLRKGKPDNAVIKRGFLAMTQGHSLEV